MGQAPIGPCLGGDQSSADHIGVEKVATGLQMIRPLNRIFGNGRQRRHITGHVRVE